jgi:hypothetical protein
MEMDEHETLAVGVGFFHSAEERLGANLHVDQRTLHYVANVYWDYSPDQ